MMTSEEIAAERRMTGMWAFLAIILTVSTIGSLGWGFSRDVQVQKMRGERDAVIKACQERVGR